MEYMHINKSNKGNESKQPKYILHRRIKGSNNRLQLKKTRVKETYKHTHAIFSSLASFEECVEPKLGFISLSLTQEAYQQPLDILE